MGEVYLSQNITLSLKEVGVDLKTCKKPIKYEMFSTSVFPTAADIVTFSGKHSDQLSIQLEEHLRYLLADPNFDESNRELKISVVTDLFPNIKGEGNSNISLWYCIWGPFMDNFEILSTEQTFMFKANLSNFLKFDLAKPWREVKLFEPDNHEKGERKRISHRYRYWIRWVPGIKDMINGTSLIGNTPTAKLSVAMSANIVERMMLPLPIISPNGMSYQLPLSLNNTLSERKKQPTNINHSKVILVAANETRLECDYNYLVESSPVLQTMLSNERFEEAHTRTIDMSDMSEDAVTALINYLCNFEVDLPIKHFPVTLQLLQASEKYGIEGLQITMKTLLLSKKCENFDIGDALDLFTFSRLVESMTDLRNKALQILRLKQDQLTHHKKYKQLFVKHPHIAMDLCTILLQTYCACDNSLSFS